MQERNNIEGLDSLRAIATIGVIVIHTATPVVKMSFGDNPFYWWVGNLYDGCVRFSVPMFLMLSGATLLHKEYRLSDYFRRRFTRVLLPFLFWMVVYWIFRWSVLPAKEQPHDFLPVVQWAGQLFANEGISKHFWYVYMILFLYLFIPFMGKCLRKLNNKYLLVIVLCWAIALLLLRNIPLNFYRWDGNWDTRLLAYLEMAGYLVMGFYLQRMSLDKTWIKLVAAVVFLLTIGVVSGFTWWLSKWPKTLDISLYGNLTINTILQTASLFILLKDSRCSSRIVLWIQQRISNYSYGIYLAHIMILGICFNHGIFWTMGNPLWTLPLMILLLLIISSVIVLLLRKLPYGRYISG
jgi:surface polysaccharide O-acyltransferase-like enzyme